MEGELQSKIIRKQSSQSLIDEAARKKAKDIHEKTLVQKRETGDFYFLSKKKETKITKMKLIKEEN